MLTKKHFKALAEALHRTKPDAFNQELSSFLYKSQWILDLTAVANVCQESNPEFDREKFYRAAGLEK